VDYDILQENGIETDAMKNIVVNKETNETNIENVFIGGDAFTGPATVVEAIAGGTKIAKAIMRKEQKLSENFFDINVTFDNEKRAKEIVKMKGEIQVCDSIDSEAARCLECNFICNICSEVCPNRANIQIPVSSLKDRNQIIHIDGMCNECGNCETFCPYDGAPYKDKFTLFWTLEDFKESINNGFVIINENRIKLRMKKVIFELDMLDNKIIGCHPEGIIDDKAIFEIIETVLKNYKYLLNFINKIPL